MPKVVFKPGTARRMKSYGLSPARAKRLSSAIKVLETEDIDALKKTGRVRKVAVASPDNLFTYRVGLRERILFSDSPSERIVEDIVNVGENSSLYRILGKRK